MEIDSIPLVLSELGQVKQSLEEIKEKLCEFEGVSPVHEDTDGESDAIARRLDILSDKTNEIIERSENGVVSDELREVTDEIAEIRESLLTDYEKIKDDISFIRNQIELNVEEAESETALDLGDEDINTILEELAEIKVYKVVTDR